MALTPKQQRFVEEYLIDLNATQAAIRAGYSQKNANKIGPELLGKTRCQEAIAAGMGKRAKNTKITQDWVLEHLQENVERAMQYAEIKDSHGNSTGEFKYDGSVANRALELLGKHLGMFIDRSEVTVREDPIAVLMKEIDGTSRGLPQRSIH